MAIELTVWERKKLKGRNDIIINRAKELRVNERQVFVTAYALACTMPNQSYTMEAFGAFREYCNNAKAIPQEVKEFCEKEFFCAGPGCKNTLTSFRLQRVDSRDIPQFYCCRECMGITDVPLPRNRSAVTATYRSVDQPVPLQRRNEVNERHLTEEQRRAERKRELHTPVLTSAEVQPVVVRTMTHEDVIALFATDPTFESGPLLPLTLASWPSPSPVESVDAPPAIASLSFRGIGAPRPRYGPGALAPILTSLLQVDTPPEFKRLRQEETVAQILEPAPAVPLWGKEEWTTGRKKPSEKRQRPLWGSKAWATARSAAE